MMPHRLGISKDTHMYIVLFPWPIVKMIMQENYSIIFFIISIGRSSKYNDTRGYLWIGLRTQASCCSHNISIKPKEEAIWFMEKHQSISQYCIRVEAGRWERNETQIPPLSFVFLLFHDFVGAKRSMNLIDFVLYCIVLYCWDHA
jgi:hypothetical protein